MTPQFRYVRPFAVPTIYRVGVGEEETGSNPCMSDGVGRKVVILLPSVEDHIGQATIFGWSVPCVRSLGEKAQVSAKRVHAVPE